MLGDALKAIVNGLVLLLATLAFFTVPVGRKTSAQHVAAIFTTPQARAAARAFAAMARRTSERVAGEVERARRELDGKPSPSRAD